MENKETLTVWSGVLQGLWGMYGQPIMMKVVSVGKKMLYIPKVLVYDLPKTIGERVFLEEVEMQQLSLRDNLRVLQQGLQHYNIVAPDVAMQKFNVQVPQLVHLGEDEDEERNKRVRFK